MSRHPFVVTAENLDPHAVGRQRGDRDTRALLRRIKEDDEAGKNEIAFVSHRRCGSVRLEFAPSDTKRPEPVVAERFEDLCRPRSRRDVKQQRLGLARFFVSAGDADDVLRRALGDQQTEPVALDQDRDRRR